MFAYPVSLTSASSTTDWIYSDEIDIHPKWNDKKRISVKVDIASELTACCTAVHINYLLSDRSGGTYCAVVTGSGTSILLASGTSTSGQYSNGSHFIPLTVVTASGVTEWLTAGVAPFIKIGSRADDATAALSVKLLVG